jgi:hypothetical protein
MVRSEVVLWALEDVGAVNDLRSVMESLGGEGSVRQPTTEWMGAVAEALLSPDIKRPVLTDLDAWPGIIAGIWAGLWPEARRTFAARAAMSPPQGGESAKPPWLFVVPPERVLQWSGYPVIKEAPSSAAFSRAARWFVNRHDPSFDEVLAACRSPDKLPVLGQIARAADRLDRMRGAPKPHHSLDLLRTLIALAPDPNDALSLKREALRIIKLDFSDTPLLFIVSLRNLDPIHLPEESIPENELSTWVGARAADLPLEESVELLSWLSSAKAEAWWLAAVNRGLCRELVLPQPRWARAALRWLGVPESAEALRERLPTTSEVESQLLSEIADINLSDAQLQRIRQAATDRGWSRLHALTVIRLLPAHDAFQVQLAFPASPLVGLTLLIERLPGAIVVEEAVTLFDMEVTALVAKRTARDPNLLRSMESTNPAWRALWAAHIAAGGACWPPGADREALGRGLLDAVLQGDGPLHLVASLAEDLREITLDHPRRAALWKSLGPDDRTALLSATAAALATRCEAGSWFPSVEPPLAEAVALRTRQKPPSARLLAALLEWNVQLDEQDVIKWLRGAARSGWAHNADGLGRAVLKAGWKQAASELYSLSKWAPELRPAVDVCQDLLPWWDRLLFSLSGSPGKPTGMDEALLAKRVAELGADLAPDRLDALWERAGGSLKHLSRSCAPDARWQQASELARKGMLKDGLLALFRELYREFPHNKSLQEIEKILYKNLSNRTY